MTSMTGTRRIVISTAGLAAASAVFGVIMLASQPMSSAMSGMDHGGGVATEVSQVTTGSGDMAGMDMSGSSPAPTDHGEMAGMDMSGSSPAPTNPAEMPMDMGGMDMSGSSPAPTTHGDMPGMDMPGMDMPGMDSGSGDAHGATPGHGSETEAAADRPLAPVLGTFGGGSAAVLLSAGLLRRKDRAASLAKESKRAAARGRK